MLTTVDGFTGAVDSQDVDWSKETRKGRDTRPSDTVVRERKVRRGSKGATDNTRL